MIQTDKEKQLIEQFLADTTYFRAPDPEIMYNAGLAPITEREEEVIEKNVDATMSLVRNKLQAAVIETCETMMQTGAAPGAKWGDLIAGIYTASGDLSLASTQGIVLFATTAQYAVKFTKKYWMVDKTVQVRPGDAFMHNDARYGGVHNADFSMVIPIFYKGELVAWAGTIVHEGENGAVEPGGVPSLAESKFMEGLSLPPIKVAENYTLKNDIVTFLQNSTREPMLMMQDLKVKLAAVIRLQKRVDEAIDEFGVETVIATLRKTLDDTDKEVKRRIKELPDMTTRSIAFLDGTLRENVLMKVQIEVRKKDDQLILDFSGSSPEFLNRAHNSNITTVYGISVTVFLFYIWPDLPRNQAILNAMNILVDDKSIINCSNETPSAQCMATAFPLLSLITSAMMKLSYPAEKHYTKIGAPIYNQISTFLYGGITQNGELVGNIGTDLNAMPGGARCDRDGEHSLTIAAAAMADQGEQELIEEEIPWVHLSRKLLQDNQGFGKYRGGSGYQMIVTAKDTPYWGLMSTSIGSKVPTMSGLYGGYGCPTYPLAKVKGVNTLELMKEGNVDFDLTIVDIMNKRPFENAEYSTSHRGMGLEVVLPGELYMTSQGAGGGYGDVLERDPSAVIKDLEDGIISNYVAKNIYHIEYNEETLALDEEGTNVKREAEKKARLVRAISYQEFEQSWVSNKPPAHIPWYGTWKDKNVFYVGESDVAISIDQLQPIQLPDPRDVKIAQLEAQLKVL